MTATATEAMDQVDCHNVSFYAVMTCDTITEAGVYPRVVTDFDEATRIVDDLRRQGFDTACIKAVSVPAWSLVRSDSDKPRTIAVEHCEF